MKKQDMNSLLLEIIKKHDCRGIIMLELPIDFYFEASCSFVKILTDSSFNGVYVSFNRPYKNISSVLKQRGTNMEKILFIDVATALGKVEAEKSDRCLHISQKIEIDELVQAINVSLSKLDDSKTFIFIDSLSTIALYEPLSETLRFSEFLIRTIRNNEDKKVSLIFNVAEDLSQKKFIKDIALHVDEIIKIKF